MKSLQQLSLFMVLWGAGGIAQAQYTNLYPSEGWTKFQPQQRSMLNGSRWWSNPLTAQKLELTPEQLKKMDDIFQQNRLKLIDLKASLEKQETIMRPLIEADQPDEAKILSQIDAIAQARAELEKANARMLLGIRTVLTPDQWKKFRALAQTRMEGKGKWGGPHGEGRMGPGRGPGGPDGGAPPVGPPENQ